MTTTKMSLTELYVYGVRIAELGKVMGLHTSGIIYKEGQDLNADAFAALLMGWVDGRDGCSVMA